MAIRRKKKIKRRTRKSPSWTSIVGRWLVRLVAGFLLISVLWVLALRFINPPITYLMIKRGFEWRAAGKGFKIEKKWLSYDELSNNLKRAAIAGEDAHFMSHHGFDTQAIKEAIRKNKSGKALRGGSTISQQVAKNVFLWPTRSWLRKGLESYFTVLIEFFGIKNGFLKCTSMSLKWDKACTVRKPPASTIFINLGVL